MKFSISQIAEILGGKVEGEGTTLIDSFAKIEEGKTGSISFLANPKYENYIYSTASSAVIVANDFLPKKSIQTNLIRVTDPYLSVSKLMTTYQKMAQTSKSGISTKTEIHPSAVIAKDVYIEAFVSIGSDCLIGEKVAIYAGSSIGKEVKIGSGTIIQAGVKILDNCEIGENCVLHPGVVIGSEGFGFAPDENGEFQSIPQLGNVIIGNKVSIGANSTIDRASIGSTKIGNGVKIDNLVQVAHNVEIGDNTVIASQSGISGSTKIGKNCKIGGQVGFAGHIKVADRTSIGAKSGVSKSITKPGGSFAGYPLLPIKEHLRLLVNLRKPKK